jgi:2-polyprenyl-3-methyl-5-hydroxy-6-metoxy-1,4-benzoquinol methylase
MTGTLADVPRSLRFDAILYIDVLEHIANDAEELARAAQYLEPGGTLIVLAPAYQWLFSPFDAAIGHYRRYTRGSLGAIAPPALERIALRYLDSAGLLVSMGNRLLLRRDQPTSRMIDLWDTYLVPVSRVLDTVIRFKGGRSLLGIWRHGQDRRP